MRRTHNLNNKLEQRKNLRNHGTSAEAVMWNLLKSRQVLGYKFRRQFSVGPYILDFYCVEAKLAIELDGAQHYTIDGYEHDFKRKEFLEKLHNIKILRFENKNVFDYPDTLIQLVKEELISRTNKTI